MLFLLGFCLEGFHNLGPASEAFDVRAAQDVIVSTLVRLNLKKYLECNTIIIIMQCKTIIIHW